jgi:hypothetical protein
MAAPGFWDSIARDLSGRGMFGGPFQFRLIIQPLAAMILGVKVGIRDAKVGDVPFFGALLRHRGKRGHLMAKAVRDAIVPLLIAFIVDSILQRLINGRIRPLAAALVGGLLVFVPFITVRGLANRIWSHGQSGHERPIKPSRS